MDKIKTATGRELPLGSFPTEGRGRLYIRLKTSVAEAAEVFDNNPKETRELRIIRDGIPEAESPRFALYTKLHAIVPEGPIVRVVLKKE